MSLIANHMEDPKKQNAKVVSRRLVDLGVKRSNRSVTGLDEIFSIQANGEEIEGHEDEEVEEASESKSVEYFISQLKANNPTAFNYLVDQIKEALQQRNDDDMVSEDMEDYALVLTGDPVLVDLTHSRGASGLREGPTFCGNLGKLPILITRKE